MSNVLGIGIGHSEKHPARALRFALTLLGHCRYVRLYQAGLQ